MVHCNRPCLVVAALVMLFMLVGCDDEYVHHMNQHQPGPEVRHHGPSGHDEDYDHQAMLGSEDLSEEYDGLPEPKAREGLEQLARTHDLNGDGIISKAELTQWITENFKKLDSEEATEKFTEEDKNKDQKVSWKEYVEKVYNYTPEDVDAMEKAAKGEDDQTEKGRNAKTNLKMVSDDRDFFMAADLDKDGSLSKEEYEAFYFPPSHKHMQDVELAHFMRDQDKDKDGKLSKDEFLAEDAHNKELFTQLDKNEDGFLSGEELLVWMVPKTEDMIEDEVEHLLRIGDANGDKELSMKELLDKTKEYVGSSMVDHGFNPHEEL